MESLGKSGKVDFQSFRHTNTEDSVGRSRIYEYRSSRRTPTDSFGNSAGNGFRDSSQSRPVHSFEGPSNNSGTNVKPPRSSVYYGYGGPFSLDDDFDRRSDSTQMSSDSIRNFKIQPWMTKITGGTFKRDYIDRISLRPTLQHDTTILWQDTRQLTEADDREPIRGNCNEEILGRTTLTIIFIILGVILVGIVGAVIAWFLAMKDDAPATTTYFIVSGGMHLNEDFVDELYNSSAPEFKSLSSRFCSAIREALKKNITKYGERFKHCEVNEFRNGSIDVLFTVYYVYSPVDINKEGVEEDLNVSLTAIDSKTSFLSGLIVITSTINLTVTVKTFTVDPIAIPITSTTSTLAITTSESIETTSEPLTVTTLTATDNTSLEDEATEVTITSALESTTAGKDTTSVVDGATEVITTSALESTTAGEDTTSVVDGATEVITTSALESTTAATDTTSVYIEATEVTTTSAFESTTAATETTSVVDEETEVTTISVLESTTAGIDTTSVVDEAAEVTTASALGSTTAGTETTKIDKETEMTTDDSSNSETTTDALTTENSESTMSVVDSTIFSETTIKTTSTMIPEITSDSTLTKTATEIENTSTSIEENITSTTSEPTTAAVEYSADVNVEDIVAIVDEITQVRACEVIPKGSWLYVNISIVYQGTSIVKEKFDYNNDILKTSSEERFSVNIGMKDSAVVANLTLNLTTPTSMICSLYDQYIVSCSVMMNDTFHTTKSNNSRIYVTAPVASITIDSTIHYNEGDSMYFNCSTKADPNYSKVKAQLIKNNRVIQEIVTNDFGNDNNSDCSVNLNWTDGSPYPLTADENGITVRCIVTNTLLNKTESADKVLNVTIADVAFSQYSYKMLTEESPEIQCIARGASSILENLTLSRNDIEIAMVNSSGIAKVLIPGSRYLTSTQQYAGSLILNTSIEGVKCEDHGTYRCTLYSKDNSFKLSPDMSFIVIGTKPTLSLHPDIYENFPRADSPHKCTTAHRGPKDSGKYLEIQINAPNSASRFKYSYKLPESERVFDTTENLTYINITESSLFILDSDHTYNSTCNNKQEITFLLSLSMEFNNGTIKCVLKDDMIEFASSESQITVIPRNYCNGFEDKSIRKHPSNDCNKYVYCHEEGKMYAFGRKCDNNYCVSFDGPQYCQYCNISDTCEEITTPGPTQTATTLSPGKQYVACNDTTLSMGTNVTIICNVLDKRFTSLNITFFPAANQEREEIVGEILSNGVVQSQSTSDVVLSANFTSSPMILAITFISITCGKKGQFRIIATGTNASYAPSIEVFHLNVIGPLESCSSEAVYETDTATIVCGMNTSVSYKLINVMKNSEKILAIYPNNTVIFNVDNSNNKFECSVGSSLTFTIKNVSCSDNSEYFFTLVTDDDHSCSESKSLELKVKPTAPEMEIDYKWEVGKNEKIHSCYGNVGNPAGNLTIEIRNGTSGNFTTYNQSIQSSASLIPDNCTYFQTLYFSIDFTSSNLTNHYIRCIVSNPYIKQTYDKLPASEEVKINPLPRYICYNAGVHPYPGDCTRFLNCANNITGVTLCPAGLCFKEPACGNDCTFCIP